MSKLSQVNAVYQAVTNVLKENEIEFRDGEVNVGSILSKDMKTAVIGMLMNGFREGLIELKDTESNKAKLADEGELRVYVRGLVDNWLRKDKRLNGGMTYTAKNPGSKGHLKYATEEEKLQIKTMRHILKEIGEDKDVRDHLNDLESRIRARAPKAESKVDLSVLPENLRIKFANLNK